MPENARKCPKYQKDKKDKKSVFQENLLFKTFFGFSKMDKNKCPKLNFENTFG